jgi:hypothetical protein
MPDRSGVNSHSEAAQSHSRIAINPGAKNPAAIFFSVNLKRLADSHHYRIKQDA